MLSWSVQTSVVTITINESLHRLFGGFLYAGHAGCLGLDMVPEMEWSVETKLHAQLSQLIVSYSILLTRYCSACSVACAQCMVCGRWLPHPVYSQAFSLWIYPWTIPMATAAGIVIMNCLFATSKLQSCLVLLCPVQLLWCWLTRMMMEDSSTRQNNFLFCLGKCY